MLALHKHDLDSQRKESTFGGVQRHLGWTQLPTLASKCGRVVWNWSTQGAKRSKASQNKSRMTKQDIPQKHASIGPQNCLEGQGEFPMGSGLPSTVTFEVIEEDESVVSLEYA